MIGCDCFEPIRVHYFSAGTFVTGFLIVQLTYSLNSEFGHNKGNQFPNQSVA